MTGTLNNSFAKAIRMAIAVVLLTILSCTLVAVSADYAMAASSPSVNVTRANTGKLVLKTGKQYKLSAKTVQGASLKYKSSSKRVVSVSEKGVLKALKAGKSTITVTAKKGKRTNAKKIKVTVAKASKFKAVKKITVKAGKKNLSIGQTTKVKVTFNPKAASNKNIIYKSSNPAVASVSASGSVLAKKTGSAKITATSCDNKRAKNSVTIKVKDSRAGGDKDSKGEDEVAPIDLDNTLTIRSFTADRHDIPANEPTQVIFKAELERQEPVTDPVVVEDGNGTVVATLLDDGSSYDEAADDGTFTGEATLASQAMSEISYRASCGSEKSNYVKIFYYQEINSDDYDVVSDIIKNTNDLTTVSQVVDVLRNNDDVEHYIVSDDKQSVLYRTNAGITGIWESSSSDSSGVQVKSPSFDSSGNIIKSSSGYSYGDMRSKILSSPLAPSQANHEVCAVRPFRHSQFYYDDFSEVGDIAASKFGGSLPVSDDDAADLNMFKSFDDYGLVLIDSHGCLSNYKNAAWTIFDTDPYMLTGEEYSGWGSFTSADWQSERIVVVSKGIGGMFGGGIVAVGSKFFDTYYDDNSLDGSMFFLGTCYSMYNNTIADSLIAKGAEAVFGFSNIVSTNYCNDTLFEVVLDQMLYKGEAASNAWSAARRICGSPDSWTNYGTELKFSGDSSFTLVDNKGTVTGGVMSYETGTMIPFASVSAYSQKGVLIKKVYAGPDGRYRLKLDEGSYTLKVASYNHLTCTLVNVDVTGQNTTILENAVLMRAGTSSSINGRIIDAETGEGVPNATIRFRNDQNNFIGNYLCYTNGNVVTLTTDSGGNYRTDKLNRTYYTTEVTCDGYITGYKNIAAGGADTPQDITLSRALGENNLRVVLVWGENPRDLDSHMTGADEDGGEFEVYFDNENYYLNDGSLKVNLDLDETDSYGPETTTLYDAVSGTYHFFVHRYAGSGSIATSSAQVKVYRGESLIGLFNAPPDCEGDYWNVFDYDASSKRIIALDSNNMVASK